MFFIAYLCVFLLPLVTAQCPPKDVPPCTCVDIGGFATSVNCLNVENDDDLRNSLSNLRPFPVRRLVLMNSSLTYIPSDAFKGLTMEMLVLADSTFMSLTETDTAFVGLETSLKTLRVVECNLLNGWDWSHFRKLSFLSDIFTIKSGVTSIEEDIKAIAHLDLSNLHLTQDSISYIHDTAFQPFHHLKVLSLKMNKISIVKRSMFPIMANDLEHINLSYNRLETLPEDLFTNMPGLYSIILNNNYFLSVARVTFQPVWSKLRNLDLLANPLHCDCRMLWLLQETLPRNTWIQCDGPKKLKGKEIQQIVANDLKC